MSEAITCPKCSGQLVTKTYGSLEVDRCETCKGTWLDAGEAKRIKDDESLVGQLIDNEVPDGSTQWNEVRKNMDCPRCSKPLQKITSEKHNLHYEGCLFCNGLFLDSGELANFDSGNAGTSDYSLNFLSILLFLSPILIGYGVFRFQSYPDGPDASSKIYGLVAFGITLAAIILYGIVKPKTK